MGWYHASIPLPRFRDAEDALNQTNAVAGGTPTEELVARLGRPMGTGIPDTCVRCVCYLYILYGLIWI